MSKRAFEKIKAGLDSAQAYLDGTADRRRYRARAPEATNARKPKDGAAADDFSPSS